MEQDEASPSGPRFTRPTLHRGDLDEIVTHENEKMEASDFTVADIQEIVKQRRAMIHESRSVIM